MSELADAASLAQAFRQFAVTTARAGEIAYPAICRGVAEDPSLLALAALAPPAQRRPNLLLAAVHYLLLGGADDPLADHYPTVAAWRSGSRPVPAAAPLTAPAPDRGHEPAPARDVYAEFASFCRHHREALATLVRQRATQTNEVGRCTALWPALAEATTTTNHDLALVDLGASAGLHLLLDRYAYAYSTPSGGPTVTAGDPASPLVLRCTLRAGIPSHLSTPAIRWRAGLDLRPIAPGDEEATRWLLACIWPDDLARFERLRTALAIAAHRADDYRLLPGDLVDDLPGLVASVPMGLHLVLFHAWAVAYLTPERQRRLAETIAALGAERPLSWIYAEQPDEVPGLHVPAASRATALVLTRFDGRRTTRRLLAAMHPHGRWLSWHSG